MYVTAFAPSIRAVLDEDGGISATGFPMTNCTVGPLPTPVTFPVILAVWTRGGTDYDPRRYIVARSPDGERSGMVECAWHWPDKPGTPIKSWVLVRQLTMLVTSPGVYDIGLYSSPDETDTDHLFPLTVFKNNPWTTQTQVPARG